MKKIIRILLFVALIISVFLIVFFTYVFNQLKDVNFDENKLTIEKRWYLPNGSILKYYLNTSEELIIQNMKMEK